MDQLKDIVTNPILTDLVEHVKKGECILFLGAGIHAPPPDGSQYTNPDEHRLPLGGDLSERMAEVSGFREEFPFIQLMADKAALHPIPETVRYRMKKWPMLFVGTAFVTTTFASSSEPCGGE